MMAGQRTLMDDGEEVTTYRIERGDEPEEDLSPPFVIIVQGSKESGKTTLSNHLSNISQGRRSPMSRGQSL